MTTLSRRLSFYLDFKQATLRFNKPESASVRKALVMKKKYADFKMKQAGILTNITAKTICEPDFKVYYFITFVFIKSCKTSGTTIVPSACW